MWAPGPIAPIDPAAFRTPTPSDFDEGDFGSLEEQEALESFKAQLYDIEADNYPIQYTFFALFVT